MSCSGDCANCPMREACGSGGVPDAMRAALKDVQDSLEKVRHKVLVLSGKGGVGKSTVTYLLSKYLSLDNIVGVLDLDLCGPSMPYLFKCQSERMHQTAFGLSPAYATDNISLVSAQFFLENEDDANIARGSTKNTYVLQFLKDVDWGDTEYLVVDTPPGTSDEHLSIVSFMSQSGIDGAVIVTTPEEVAISDVRREIKFCQRAGVKILGIIENMSSFTCQRCGKSSSIYPQTNGGAEQLCREESLPLLGKLPIDPSLVAGCIGENFEISPAIQESLDRIGSNLMGVLGESNL
ncbi:Cytosolic Fe-S cluster assembly factor nubp1 [Tritrichomonas foetus]|uniref:Cytosolic Fe-S cluster assembly factor nubp1 n=1 Tax=Tritrichomonas foetus TaxID=1144522 RepID=A0A1J4K7A7_9EUKA|nr:Cytosolic Fe-S cluster assembly factor nubp1 [Tritrichomonas foetus]|eukprot:OHT05582.1 Cytosolic Fe-S cluster assembly factor nubp1 [Tritrichomonas foetus]